MISPFIRYTSLSAIGLYSTIQIKKLKSIIGSLCPLIRKNRVCTRATNGSTVEDIGFARKLVADIGPARKGLAPDTQADHRVAAAHTDPGKGKDVADI